VTAAPAEVTVVKEEALQLVLEHAGAHAAHHLGAGGQPQRGERVCM
jgi:hypothetical protein